jgi:hypothetical protein
MAIWKNSDSYSQRLASLRNGGADRLQIFNSADDRINSRLRVRQN